MSLQPKAKAPKKPTQYAKNAKVGDLVHIKASHVSNHGQLRRWFGSQANSHWFTGTLEEIAQCTVGKTKTTMYNVRYLLPDGFYKLLRKKNIHHCPVHGWILIHRHKSRSLVADILEPRPWTANSKPPQVWSLIAPTIQAWTLFLKDSKLERMLMARPFILDPGHRLA
jgi:hypothetical protein